LSRPAKAGELSRQPRRRIEQAARAGDGSDERGPATRAGNAGRRRSGERGVSDESTERRSATERRTRGQPREHGTRVGYGAANEGQRREHGTQVGDGSDERGPADGSRQRGGQTRSGSEERRPEPSQWLAPFVAPRLAPAPILDEFGCHGPPQLIKIRRRAGRCGRARRGRGGLARTSGRSTTAGRGGVLQSARPRLDASLQNLDEFRSLGSRHCGDLGGGVFPGCVGRGIVGVPAGIPACLVAAVGDVAVAFWMCQTSIRLWCGVGPAQVRYSGEPWSPRAPPRSTARTCLRRLGRAGAEVRQRTPGGRAP
jgi:hypothetical protein